MATISSSALALLRDSLSPAASVNLPGDAGYSNKRWALNAEKPAAIVVSPATPEDVVQTLAFAQGKAPYDTQKKLDLAVKGGGHAPSGASSSDGGLVIDLQPKMNQVRVDPEAKRAYVAGGSLWGDVDEATISHGLASVSGIVNHTGVGGLTLGGGFGWLCGQHGLVIDNVVQYTIVTGSGDILTVSSTSNPDLFWALRGGGGNFGVVTEFVLRLHDQRPDLYNSTLIYPPSMLERVVPEVNKWLNERAPEESMHMIFGIGPNGLPGVVLQMVFNGDSKEGEMRFERFVKLGPVMNISETIPYLKLNTLQNQSEGHGTNRLFQGNFIPVVSTGLPLPLIQAVFDAWQRFVTDNATASGSVIAIELYHPDKWASVPSDATAYPYRNPSFNIAYIMQWNDSSFTPHVGPAATDIDKVFIEYRDQYFERELTRQGGYVNYFDEENRSPKPDFVHKRFGSNFKRLVEIKNKYDGGNLFGRWFVTPKSI